MPQTRRSLLTAVGTAVPLAIASQARSEAAAPTFEDGPLTVRYQKFEDAVRRAFAQPAADGTKPRRVEVGANELFEAGLQGCTNREPFAGFRPGQLRIVRAGSAPGPAVRGFRAYISWVELVADENPTAGRRKVDFTANAPAPQFA